jgi:hypothetical protein
LVSLDALRHGQLLALFSLPLHSGSLAVSGLPPGPTRAPPCSDLHPSVVSLAGPRGPWPVAGSSLPSDVGEMLPCPNPTSSPLGPC